jgi:N-carbamoylputrescine amidase
MRDFRLALMQLTIPQSNSVAQNLAKMEGWVRQAAEAGANLVMFGELATSGYLLNSAGLQGPGSGSSVHYQRAEAIPGEATQKLAEMAHKYGVFIAAGMGDLQAGVVYNTFVLVGPQGYIGKQHKLHIPVAEYPYYGAGSAFQVFDIGLCKLGISICFDNWFPETSRILALQGAEVLLAPWMWIVPAGASPEGRRQAESRRKNHLKFFPARALDNAMYVAVLDHVGAEKEGFEFPGVSLVFDPFGNLIAETEMFKECMLIADLKAAEVEKYRTYGHHFTLKYRRPEIYGVLTELIP